jgi:DNA primase
VKKASRDYQELIQDINIVDELDLRGIKGKTSGKNYMFCCPFHNETTSSFGILLEDTIKKGKKRYKGTYGCFTSGCLESGNFFDLISYLDEISLKESIRLFKKDFVDSKKINNIKKLFSKIILNKEEYGEIKVFNKKFLNNFVFPDGDFLEYLTKERKLNLDSIKKFNILACKKNIKLKSEKVLWWKDRIVIPYLDTKSRFVGATARIIYETDKKRKVRKLPGSDISLFLFGLKQLKDRKILVLVEGEIDAIYLQQFGIPAVAIGKASFSEEQLNEISEFADEVYVCLDGEVEKEFVMDIVEKLRKYVSCSPIFLPGKKDPNDLSEKEIKKIFQFLLKKMVYNKK